MDPEKWLKPKKKTYKRHEIKVEENRDISWQKKIVIFELWKNILCEFVLLRDIFVGNLIKNWALKLKLHIVICIMLISINYHYWNSDWGKLIMIWLILWVFWWIFFMTKQLVHRRLVIQTIKNFNDGRQYYSKIKTPHGRR